MEKKLCKNECFLKWDTKCLRETNGEDSEQSQKFEGKPKKQFQKLSLKCKTCVFRGWYKSPVSRQNTSSQKFWKNLLSFFRDWKSHSRRSRELSRNNLYVPLTTGPSTQEQVAKIDLQARDCGMRLGWPATESPK